MPTDSYFWQVGNRVYTNKAKTPYRKNITDFFELDNGGNKKAPSTEPGAKRVEVMELFALCGILH